MMNLKQLKYYNFPMMVAIICSLFSLGSALAADLDEMIREVNEEFKSVPRILPDDIQSQENYLYVDVREDYEIEISTIPGAITMREFKKDLKKYKNRKIIMYCTIGYRSSKVVRKYLNKGFMVQNMEGSILYWIKYGRTLVNSEGKPTKNVHTYGKKWAIVPKGFTAIY